MSISISISVSISICIYVYIHICKYEFKDSSLVKDFFEAWVLPAAAARFASPSCRAAHPWPCAACPGPGRGPGHMSHAKNPFQGTIVDSAKLQYGSGTCNAGFRSLLGFGYGGYSYSNFLASTLYRDHTGSLLNGSSAVHKEF